MSSSSPATALTLDIVTPERVISSGEVEMVVIPGSEGEFGVLAGHTPVISSMRPGVVRIYKGDQVIDRFLVSSGFAEVTPSRCTILASEAYDFSSSTREEIEKRIALTRKLHEQAENEQKKMEAEDAVNLAEKVLDAFISENDSHR